MVSCPNVAELSVPKLKSIYGAVIDGDTKIKVLSLPSVEIVASIVYYNVQVESFEINMPSVRELNSSILGGVNRTRFKNAIYHFGAPQGGNIIIGPSYNDANDLVSVITVMQGFRSTLNIQYCTGLSADVLRAIIVNLGDNTGYAPLALTIGSDNLAKLSDEDIALAVAKNYSLS